MGHHYQTIVEFKNHLGALVAICSFNASLSTRMNIWLTLQQVTDLQHSLWHFDVAHFKLLQDFFQRSGLKYKWGFNSSTAVSPSPTLLTLLNFCTGTPWGEFHKWSARSELCTSRTASMCWDNSKRLPRWHAAGTSMSYKSATIAVGMRGYCCPKNSLYKRRTSTSSGLKTDLSRRCRVGWTSFRHSGSNKMFHFL